jgi:hypothetical protein
MECRDGQEGPTRLYSLHPSVIPCAAWTSNPRRVIALSSPLVVAVTSTCQDTTSFSSPTLVQLLQDLRFKEKSLRDLRQVYMYMYIRFTHIYLITYYFHYVLEHRCFICIGTVIESCSNIYWITSKMEKNIMSVSNHESVIVVKGASSLP